MPNPNDSRNEEQEPPNPSEQKGTLDALQSPIVISTGLRNTDQTSNPQNMEVHHHPDVEKKGIKEYLLEGLMIFLAVTMGFFAETIRENITEHDRATVFAASMVKDLEADTAQLTSYINYFSNAANNVDTLMQMLAVDEPKNIASGKLYWFGLWGGAHRYFIPNDATFQQMKNSGSLRYFSRTVAKDVAKYDRFCRLMQTHEEMVRDIYTEIRKSRAQIFDFKYNEAANKISRANILLFDQGRIDSFIRSNPPLLSYDKILFNQYVELVRSRFMRTNISNADSLLQQGSVLINELQNKYALRNE